MPSTLSDSFFGSIALKNRMLTRDQLTRALRIQQEQTKDGRGPTLGEVCRMLGFLREDEVDAILRAQERSELMLEDSLLGQICLHNRLVTRAQLQEALEDQRALDYTGRLGDLLCRKGYLDRQQLQAVLKTQDRLKSGRLMPVIVPPEKPKPGPEGWAAAPPARPAAKSAAKRGGGAKARAKAKKRR